ncbi:MAG: hypothetical protein IIA02_10705 [Proteobacteria bacterium]|nr:hypothetical protein [Pseudomonadota bacterium]
MIAIGKDDQITAAERYALATGSSNLTPNLGARCDADKLIAAAWVSKDPRRAAAMALYRMAVVGSTNGLQTIADTMDGWLNGKLQRKARPIPKVQRREMVVHVLRWWLRPTCGYCEGRAFELVGEERDDDREGARTLSGRACKACHGTGKRPVEREVPPHLKDAARQLADELDRLVLLVTGEMARVLRDRMPDLGVAP